MLNPAWQPAQDQAERLVHISHHFLSDTAPPAPQASAADSVLIPILLALSNDLPERQDAGYLVRALARQLNLPGAASGQDWNLRTCAHPGEMEPCRLAVLMIDASLDMTRAAYTLIKQMRQRNIEHIGVIYRAGDDLAAARRCYRRLAVGTLRFLDLPLVNLGWLPNPGPHFAASLARAAQVIHSQRGERAQQESTRSEVMQ